VTAPAPASALYYEWVDGISGLAGLEEVSVRALLSVFRHLTGSREIRVERTHSSATLRAVGSRFSVEGAARRTLDAVAVWTTFDVTVPTPFDGSVHVSPRVLENDR
jgi:hypothetical protein